jgi:hypothetical protein
MLVPDPLLGRTRPAWLGTGPVSSTPAAVKGELDKLAYLRGMDAHTLDLSVLPAERRRFLMALRDGLRSGDVHVPGSRRYADPASFLLTPQQWKPQRLEYCHLVGKPPTAADALALANDELHAALSDLEAQLARGGGNWPTHHEDIHFYGTHSVDVAGELAKLGSDGYRPLRADTLTAVLAGA